MIDDFSWENGSTVGTVVVAHKCCTSKEKKKVIMIIEHTKNYKMRMIYIPETGEFMESDRVALMHARNFDYPYGWIKESGTPPEPHCDCILMSNKDYELGDEVAVRIIGMFKRNDGDHKYIVVENNRAIYEFEDLEDSEKAALKRLFPRVDEGEGWFGKNEAEYCYENCERGL